jgi:ATP-binding cassette subfamily B protein
MSFPHYTQTDAMDCGPTCLRIIARYYGKHYNVQTLRERCYITREGVSMLGISHAAESIGFRSKGVKVSFESLHKDAPLPAIVHWNQSHFVVVYKITGKNGNDLVYISDPASGLVKIPKEEFLRCWASTVEDGENHGVVLILETSQDFYSAQDEKPNKKNFSFIFGYLRPYKKLIIQLLLGLVLGSLLQLIFPFLTQSLVDKGIGNRNIGFIYLVLIAQLVLTLSRVSVEFIRGWILLHLGTRISISLISDFLIKLMRLPMSYFDSKMVGDLIQRIGDNTRIQSFLTSTTLNVMFSLINLVIFGVVLLYYNLTIFLIFLAGSLVYAIWVWLFMKRREELDYRRFAQMAANQSNVIQLIQGMQEIKLDGCEQQKRWEWERIQEKLFKVSIKGLALSQYQQSGATLINEVKNILITIVAAKSTVNGSMSLGMMLAVQYIIGQMNSPIDQLISFFNLTQDAKISLDRLGEVHLREDEEDFERLKIIDIPEQKDIELNNLSFRYDEPESDLVLKNINLKIEVGKQTAIVGTSGSGKTTLVKLLLGFYPPTEGNIFIGETDLSNFSISMWRDQCGVVMQDGFIYSDTIANNIAPKADGINKQRLANAVEVANIADFIDQLPLGFNTKVGGEGHGLSQGQKQRILIARSVYKDPKFIFLDEATNSLDANNEKVILENLQEFFKGRTVIVVAHRLSTVKNADKIVVLEKGRVVEVGTHRELSELKGAYYTLVKNQLEL